MFCKKVFLEILQNSQENTCARLWHRCFPMNFAKFLRIPFLTEHLRWLLVCFISVYLQAKHQSQTPNRSRDMDDQKILKSHWLKTSQGQNSSKLINSGCLFHLMAIYNHFHNILRLFDVLPNFPFTTSETMRDYYL